MEEINDFFIYLTNEKNYSKNTLKSYKIDVDNFLQFVIDKLNKNINSKTLIELDFKDFSAWLSDRFNSGLTSRSNARALSAVKSMFKFLQKRYNIFNPIVSKIKTPKIQKALPRTVSLNNFLKMQECIIPLISDVWCQKRDKALLTLIYSTGMRISEALSINNSSFIGKDLIKVYGKGNKERILPLLSIAKLQLDEYMNLCPYKNCFDKYLFVGKSGKKYSPTLFQRLLQKIRRLLNLPENITPHAFRHSFATDLLNAGASIRIIQALLGHENLATTQIYTHLEYKKLLTEYQDKMIVK